MWGSLISAGASLIGGLMGQSSNKKAMQMTMAENERNRQFQNEHNLRQEALQREFAQSGIQWRVEDAQKAGIHPIFATGAQIPTYSPTSFVGSNTSFSPDMSMANAVSSMGQDIGRAIDSTRPADKRAQAMAEAAQSLSLQKMGLENELLSAQIARVRQTPTPAFPGAPTLIPGQGNTSVDVSGGLVKNEPLERVVPAPAAASQEPAPVTDMGYTTTNSGGRFPTMSKDAKERLEEDFIGGIAWNVRNRLLPSLGINQNPPSEPVPKGYDRWIYNPLKQEYQPMRRGYFGIYY